MSEKVLPRGEKRDEATRNWGLAVQGRKSCRGSGISKTMCLVGEAETIDATFLKILYLGGGESYCPNQLLEERTLKG